MSAHTLPAIIPSATPVPQQFTREQQIEFLEALSNWGNVSAATRRAQVSRATAYRMRRACSDFARLWDAALLLARPQVEAVLADRALNGVEEKVFYHGEEVARRTRYDARLLLAHIGRLDRLQDQRATRRTAAEFDDELEALLAEPDIAIEHIRKPPARLSETRCEEDAGSGDGAI